MNPQNDLITHILKRHILFISKDHLRLSFDKKWIISEFGFDEPISVFGIKLCKVNLLLKFILKLFVVVFHVESGVILIELLYFLQSLIPFDVCFSKESDRLVKLSQSSFYLLFLEDNGLNLFVEFYLFSAIIELVKIFEFLESFLFQLLLFQFLFLLLFLKTLLLLRDGRFLDDGLSCWF